jgi:D-alanyl-D-alanine carboxypeptidase
MRTTVVEDPAAPDGNRYGLGLERVVTPCGVVWGHDGQVPGYSTENYTDDTGRRTVAIFSATIFGLSAADHALVNGAICTMLGRPLPAA